MPETECDLNGPGPEDDNWDCDRNEFCEVPPGQDTGSCRELTGSCGYADNWAWIPYNYECGSEPGCPSCPLGQQCVNHLCISYNLTGPEAVIVNSTATIHATNGTGACILCDLVITDPAGKQFTGKTDEKGNMIFPTPLKGTYNVTLLIGGQPYKSILVNALPRAPPSEPKPTTEISPQEPFPWWLIILLILIILGILYWRRKKEKRVK